MSVIIDGTSGVNTPNTFAFKNRIIDGGFILNQRGYVSGTALASGSYGHDRFKGGASGGTYTFTQAATGVNTTITITAGSLIQVIEGANLPEGGTYTLSWTGTAQGKIGGGSFSASPVSGTITAGTNTNIEFNTGTCGNVQLEIGAQATSFDYRSYGTELQLCQRYYQKSYDIATAPATATGNGQIWSTGGSDSSGNGYYSYRFVVPMRTTPTMTGYRSDGYGGYWNYERSGSSGNNIVQFDSIANSGGRLYTSNGASGWAVTLIYGHWVATAEL